MSSSSDAGTWVVPWGIWLDRSIKAIDVSASIGECIVLLSGWLGKSNCSVELLI